MNEAPSSSSCYTIRTLPMTMSGVRLMAVALASCLLAGRAAALHAAERPWLEVRSPHFVAVSDVSEKSARDALWAFEQMRAAIHKMWPFAGVDADRPIVLLLPRGESGMRELLPRLAEQKLQGTPSSTFATGPDCTARRRARPGPRDDTPGSRTRVMDLEPARRCRSSGA
jgi:hypothetical protein